MKKILCKEGFFDRLKLSFTAGIINTDLDFDEYYMYQGVYSTSSYYTWKDGNYANSGITLSQGVNNNLGYVKRKRTKFWVGSSYAG